MSLPRRKLTPQEYLDIERGAECKSEFFRGQMFAMAGASEPHELVKTNVAAELHSRFRNRPCTVYTSDMRVKVSPTGLYTYPDIVAVCGERQFEDDHRDTLLNPSVVLEILSPSTEAYDRGAKFAHYRQIGSLNEYILVAADRVSVDHYVRQPDGAWTLHAYTGGEDVLYFTSLGARLSLAEVYAGVDFPDDLTLRPA